MKIDSRKKTNNSSAEKYVDTDVIIRLLTSDDIIKQKAAAVLFEKVFQGRLVLIAPVTVVADVVYVLFSKRLYDLSRVKIRDMLTPLITLSNFKVENKQIVLQALDLYASSNLDFGDAFLIASARQARINTIYSYDHDFDHIEGIFQKNRRIVGSS